MPSFAPAIGARSLEAGLRDGVVGNVGRGRRVQVLRIVLGRVLRVMSLEGRGLGAASTIEHKLGCALSSHVMHFATADDAKPVVAPD
jgi:hypothetical protein